MSRYAVGIDLGTTNCALSYRDITESAHQSQRESTSLNIPQLTATGTIEKRLLLPTSLYLPIVEEFPACTLALPRHVRSHFIAGEFALTLDVKVPARLVGSAQCCF